MTNFIYNMQDELFHLPLEDFSTIKKLVDHIEAHGKQLRELNKSITKKNATIKKYECEKKDLQERNSCLYKKVVELNNGIRNSEDLTWKQKYEALLHSSEQAIGALQKKCQEYKNSESDVIRSTIKTLVKENNELKEVEALDKVVRCPWGNNAEIISAKTARIKGLEEKNKALEDNFEKLKHDYDELINQRNMVYYENKNTIAALTKVNNNLLEEKKAIEKRCREAEKALEDEKQVSKDLNAIINSKNKLLDEYMTKANKLKKEKEILSKRDGYISELENEVAGLKKELAVWKTDDKRNFFGNTFDMHSIYDLNRLEEVIAHKIKSYDSRLYSLMAERDKYKESSEEYRLRLMVAERQCDEYKNFEKENCDLRRRLSIIEDAIKK